MKSLSSRFVPIAVLAVLLCPLTAGAARADVASRDTTADPVGGQQLGSTGVVADLQQGATRLPRLSASSYLVADLDTGDVLAAKNPHGRLRPASTLKILTALTLLPRLDPDQVYRAVWEDAAVEGSRVGVVPGAPYTVHNLFEGLFLVSGNDAANALANAGGGVAQTVAAMNATATRLGALDTKVVNPSGLDAPRQLTSAYDLTLIAREALAREDFRAYVATVKSRFPADLPKRKTKPRKSFEIYTQDRLLLNYRGAIGVKTGWTTKARGTFVGAATRGDRTLVAAVMHTGQDSWKETAALLDWGFANADSLTPVGTLEQPAAATNAASETDSTTDTPAASTAAMGGAGGSNGLPWYGWVPLLLLGAVATLRARVVVRQRLRRQQRPVLPRLRSRG